MDDQNETHCEVHYENTLVIIYLVIGSLSYSGLYILGEIRSHERGYEMLDLLAIASAFICFAAFAIIFALCRVSFLRWLSTTLIAFLINFLLTAAWVNWGA